MAKKSFQEKLKECEKEKEEYLAGWQRAKADFLNYRKEEMERMGRVGEAVRREMLLGLLRIFDNLERAEKHIPKDFKDSEWIKGISQITAQFQDFLKEQGIEKIKANGEKFDPNLHEAVGESEHKNKESGTIIEVIQKGYKLNGQVLRPAKVKVVK